MISVEELRQVACFKCLPSALPWAPLRGILSSLQINYSHRTWPSERNVYLVKIGPKSLGDTRQDICKDKESNRPFRNSSGNWGELGRVSNFK